MTSMSFLSEARTLLLKGSSHILQRMNETCSSLPYPAYPPPDAFVNGNGDLDEIVIELIALRIANKTSFKHCG